MYLIHVPRCSRFINTMRCVCVEPTGLMQIGWADRSFRSDPVCGQGVGDHLHSWAVDGLRYLILNYILPGVLCFAVLCCVVNSFYFALF